MFGEEIDEHIILEAKKSFEGFSEDGKTLAPENLEKALRAIGLNPNPEEIEDMLEENSTIDIKAFMYIVYHHSRYTDVKHELIESFSIFDKDGNGTLPVDKIREILHKIKNPFTDEQIDQLLEKVEINNNEVDYSKFVDAMLE
ncbi:calcium-binding protein family [Trichomonas vaginalis G3]|uniref:calcium-binding protein family n=1 Tax=Trichomonas vaginalis (strain ATCC PRA-98 / G3) TaxID=412133 RepID=UPI0021E53F38|nr:calcium-binding protein family [Trichomonas vaginalis G3]KAI5486257.1 calcium-binding protein family [Trichomonas vaginalis G3]